MNPSSITPRIRLIGGVPRNVATKVFNGCACRSRYRPICSIFPSRMTAIRSPIAVASVWSWLT
ncbi:MAG TPA: hypothetical protein DCL45_11355 [Chloroflexi bacterium]|nr:hypothetical protein [Chloroflexota bacterium]